MRQSAEPARYRRAGLVLDLRDERHTTVERNRPSPACRDRTARRSTQYELDQRNPPRDEIKHRGVAGLLSQLARIHPVGSIATNVWAMNFWSSPNARSPPHAGRVTVEGEITSPWKESESISNRRITETCSAPNAVRSGDRSRDTGHMAGHHVV